VLTTPTPTNYHECDCCGAKVPRDQIAIVVAYGIDTAACEQCRGPRGMHQDRFPGNEATHLAGMWIIGRLDPPAFCVSAYREKLRMAEIRLMQSEECRIGYIADAFKNDAADLLRKVGRADLADRLDEDAWGGDTQAVLDAIREA